MSLRGNRFYRINSSGDILEELDGEPYYEAGYTAEEKSIYDAIDQTELSLMQYCDEHPEEIGSIAFRKNGNKIVVNEEA